MKILLHMCCGPCSAYPVKRLREMGYEPMGYFFNPNIHPYQEFRRRLETAEEFARQVDLTMVVDDHYPLRDFLERAIQATGSRCHMCYELRLRQAAKFAKENGYDCFTASLLISPYQQHDVIKQIAENIAAEENIAFVYEDFRSGWQEGVQISLDLALYRQPYCGCIFSEQERYDKRLRKKKK